MSTKGSLATFRRTVRQNPTFTCVYCQKSYLSRKATIDHIVPRSEGGSNHHTNLVSSCKMCNNVKGSHSVVTFQRWLKSPEGVEWLNRTNRHHPPAKGWYDRFVVSVDTSPVL